MKNNLLNKIILILLFLYFIFKPIYLLPSGMPQLADFCLILVVFIIKFFNKNYSINKQKMNKINHLLLYLYLFLGWIFFINIMWSIYLSDFSLLKPILFYVFNVLSVWVIKELYFIYDNKILYNIVKFVGISCIIQGILALLLTVGTGRATVLFNNPNQLGLYALLSLTYILILREYIKNKLFYIFSIITASYLILISLSKAAIIGMIVLLIIYFVFFTKLYKTKLILTLIALLTILFNLQTNLIEKIYENSIFNNAINRIVNMMDEDDSDLGSGRGYDRLKEIGIQIIYGTGEGGYYRFEVLNGAEIHSAYASLLSCYGIIGVLFLLLFFIKSFPIKRTYLRYYISFIGIVLYGFTHQIWRNTLLWILIEVVVILCCYKENEKENKFKKQVCLKK